MTDIAILGAGMAGFGAAHHLQGAGARSTIYEMRDHYGGHTASYRFDRGFVFDEGGHVSFTKDERLQRLLSENVNHDYQTLTTRVNNYWRGYWIKHPAQCNLYGLPADLVVRVLQDFIATRQAEPRELCTYQDWLFATYGRTFAETFPMEYGLRYHTTTADNMTTDWIGPRLYQPSLEEVLRGALGPASPDVHYISHFRYPSHGGFASYLRPFAERADLRLKHQVVAIDARTRELRFSNGARSRYDQLISSVPLPELIPMIAGTPQDVLAAAGRLACTTAVIVTLGVNRPDFIDAHWTYFYDRDIFFTRIST
ncbi:MAG: protoporphyrinogen/coproporphyrinogen oxidase, partial [Tepidiformaceae bacterium]